MTSGCGNSDRMWVEHQGRRYILYVGAATATVLNPLDQGRNGAMWSRALSTSRSQQNQCLGA